MIRTLILTLFPDMFPGPLGHSLAGTALEKGLWSLQAINIRDFAEDKHRTVDASPYGGGTGMVLKPDVLERAIDHALTLLPAAQLVYTSPRGVPLTQGLVTELKAKEDLIILCGRFEGVDYRVIEHYNMLEVSLGDFILSGGEIAAHALLDAMVRLIPGVISKESALVEESFNLSENYAGLLEYPHYTRPPSWKGRNVPDVLLSGNHEKIRAWRHEEAQSATRERRPDLWKKYTNE